MAAQKIIAGARNLLCAALACYTIYIAGWGVFDTSLVYGGTTLLGILVGLLAMKPDEPTGVGSGRMLAVHVALAAAACFIMWRWVGLMWEQEEFFVEITAFDNYTGWAAFALLGYLTWRCFGIPMLAVYLVLIAYVVAPAALGGAGEDWQRVAENLWYSSDGAFGAPVQVVSTVVLIFIVFGAVLQASGAGEVLLKFAFAATGRFAGGPAHAAIVGSALFGTMSGAAVANVVSTGIFTIPIIKRAGFKPKFAGAVEAAASTGGQIMPPVMGVVAFLMADVTGIPYLEIVVAAAIPALMYYGSLFAVVLIESRKQGVGAVPAAEREHLTGADWIKSLAFWIPLATIIVVLLQGYTPQKAGFAALIAATAMSLVFFPAFRHPKKWWEALVSAGRTAAALMVIVAAIGVVIGVINMTGIGLRFAEAILSASGENLIFALLLVMLGSLVMGMGVPTGAAYLIIALVMGPALERLGLPTIAAHLFVVYFGVLSVVTPPVALAAFAAAPIAGAKPMETGFEAVRLSIAGFIIPFVFVYHTDILIIDGVDPAAFVWTLFAYCLATWAIATGAAGFEMRRLAAWERPLRVVAGVGALFPDYRVAAPAALVAAGLIALHHLSGRPQAAAQTIHQRED